MNIFLAPHNDDETLFGSFLCVAAKPLVIVVLRSHVQERVGITYQQRERETAAACEVLGCEYEQWDFPDVRPSWHLIESKMRDLHRRFNVEAVYAPAYDFDGNRWHEEDSPTFGLFHHDKIGKLAERVFGDRVTQYQTYSRYHGRVEEGTKLEPTPEMVVAKLTALSRYQTQIAEPSTRPHFLGSLDEWIVG